MTMECNDLLNIINELFKLNPWASLLLIIFVFTRDLIKMSLEKEKYCAQLNKKKENMKIVNKSLNILNSSIKNLLININNNITILTKRLDNFLMGE